MTTSEAIDRVKELLNRPSDDDLFTDPGDYHTALTRSQQFWYRQVASHYPDLLKQDHSSNPISTSDDGRTYQLGGDHLGEMEVWTPPGPPTGRVILPAVPEANRQGFYVDGTDLKLVLKRDYDPGIYVRWVPADAPDIDGGTNPALPVYFDDALTYQAAYYMASKPGFLGDPQFYRQSAIKEWEGDPDSVSDAGILGTLSRQSAHGGFLSIGDHGGAWYHHISSQ